MELTSLYYFVFIIITLIVFSLLSNKYKQTILTAASLLFIGLFSVETIFFFLLGNLITHFLTNKMSQAVTNFQKKSFFEIIFTIHTKSLTNQTILQGLPML